MESKPDFEALAKVADRAAAAPYVDYPRDPAWTVPLFGLFGAFLWLAFNLSANRSGSSRISFIIYAALIAAVTLWLVQQRRRRGNFPSGKAPKEIRNVMAWYLVGAVAIAIALVLLGRFAPLYVGMPAGFILGAGGVWWYGIAYDRAAEKVKARLS